MIPIYIFVCLYTLLDDDDDDCCLFCLPVYHLYVCLGWLFYL